MIRTVSDTREGLDPIQRGENWFGSTFDQELPCDAVALFQSFEYGGEGEEPQAFELHTLLSMREPDDTLLSFAFPPGIHPVLVPVTTADGVDASQPQPGVGSLTTPLRAWTAVVTGVGPSAQPLTSRADLAAAPRALRSAIQAGRAEQLLSALKSCVEKHWLGGLVALAPAAQLLLADDEIDTLGILARPPSSLLTHPFESTAAPPPCHRPKYYVPLPAPLRRGTSSIRPRLTSSAHAPGVPPLHDART